MKGITLSREYGSGASIVAEMLAAQLGYQILGSQLVGRVADMLAVDKEIVEARDEKLEGLLDRIARNLRGATPEGVALVPYLEPEDSQIAAALDAIVVEASRLEPLIVLGHGAQVSLGKEPRYLHVRLVCPLDIRVQRIARSLAIDEEAARRKATEKDDERRRWTRRCWNAEIDDPRLYHLCINTGRLSLEDCVEIILGAFACVQSEPEKE